MLNICSVHDQEISYLTLPATRWQCLMSSCGVEALVEHNDFEHQKNKSPDFFKTITGAEGAAQYFCPVPHKFVFYLWTVKKHWRILSVVEEIMTPLDSVLI